MISIADIAATVGSIAYWVSFLPDLQWERPAGYPADAHDDRHDAAAEIVAPEADERDTKAGPAEFLDCTVAGLEEAFAMNLLLDRSAEQSNQDLAKLSSELGDFKGEGILEPASGLASVFTFPCERGRLCARVLLAPTHPGGYKSSS